jgi:ribosome biogenesis GTPase
VRGQIRKAVSGFYYVYANNQMYQTRARGNFRKRKIIPLVGDIVEFDSGNLVDGYILEVLSRKNVLDHPPVANVDGGIIVMSAVEPVFSLNLLDRFLVTLEEKEIEPLIYLTKIDLLGKEECDELAKVVQVYRNIGYTVIFPRNEKDALKELTSYFVDCLWVVMGQTGTGKSTLLNKLSPDLRLAAGEISKSLGRGKHTTRYVQLLSLYDGLVADTPGFSSIDFLEIRAEELSKYFPEFVDASEYCRFSECSHTHEPKCEVKLCVERGDIALSRYNNYWQFLDEINGRRVTYKKK